MRRPFARSNLILMLMTFVVGLVLAWQLKGPRASPPVGYSPADPRDRIVYTIQQLEQEQASLKSEISRLRTEMDAYQLQAAANTDRLQRLSQELDAQRVTAGLTALRGPGVAVTLDDGASRNILPVSDPNAYLIHDFDLRDVVNVLWLGGAEAIAINDERIVGNTSVYCVGSTVMVNTTRLSPPYVVRAIGEPSVLMETLRNPSYLISLRQKVERYGIRFQVTQASKLTLPAYVGGFSARHCNLK